MLRRVARRGDNLGMQFSFPTLFSCFCLCAVSATAQEESDNSGDFGISFDIVAAESSSDALLPETGAFRLRSMQLHFQNERDWGEFRVTADLADGGYGSEFVLREANVWLMNLPARSALRVGRFMPTFGAWNDILPTGALWPSSDGVRRAYWGGHLVADGLEWHQLRTTPSGRLHLSFGLAAQTHGQDVDLPGNGYRLDYPMLDGFPQGEQRETAFAHVDLLQKFGSDELSLGASASFSPRAISRLDPTIGERIERDLPHILAGVDATWKSYDSSGQGHLLTGEIWIDDREFLTDTITEGDMSIGAWAAWNWRFTPESTFGVLASFWELPDQLAVSSASSHSVWLGTRLTHRQELRFFVELQDPGNGGESGSFYGFQWSFSFGKARAASAWF
ncbi:MAG: hypothetical protein HN405_10165 [Planctomycetes bacterium]|jgi:hypothetical protein|nr:hypothetical protein [Planctomycetota bacterium]